MSSTAKDFRHENVLRSRPLLRVTASEYLWTETSSARRGVRLSLACCRESQKKDADSSRARGGWNSPSLDLSAPFQCHTCLATDRLDGKNREPGAHL